MIVVVALREGRVEQAERADDALDLPGEAAALQAHALADPERPRAEQHHAGEEVAERLLRRETDDDRGEGAADGQRPRVEPGDAQRDDDARARRRPAGSGTRPCPRSRDPGAGTASARARARRRGRSASRGRSARPRWRSAPASRTRGPKTLVAIAVDDQDPDEQRDQDDGLDARALDRAPAELPREAGLAPGVALGVEELLHASVRGGRDERLTYKDNTTLPGRYRDQPVTVVTERPRRRAPVRTASSARAPAPAAVARLPRSAVRIGS